MALISNEEYDEEKNIITVHKGVVMDSNEIGKKFVKLILDKGSNPRYHDEIINKLSVDWPLLFDLIQDTKNKSNG